MGLFFFLFLYLNIDEMGWLVITVQATLSLILMQSFSFSPSNSFHIEDRKWRFIFVLGYKQHDGHTTLWYPVHIHVHCSHAASLGQLFEIQLFWNSDHCQYYILIIFIWWPSRMQDWHEGLVICIFSSLEKLMWHCIKYHQACGLYTFSKWSLAGAAGIFVKGICDYLNAVCIVIIISSSSSSNRSSSSSIGIIAKCILYMLDDNWCNL